MADINLLGHEENGTQGKSSRRYDEPLTDPRREQAQKPNAARAASVATLVRELASRRQKQKSSPLQQIMRGERTAPPAPPTPRKSDLPRTPEPTRARAPARPAMATSIPPFSPNLRDAPRAVPRRGKITPPRAKAGLEWTNPQNHNGGGIDVNLIPTKQGSPFEPVERVRRVGVILAVNLLLVILAYFGLLLYEASLIRETQTIDAELSAAQTDVARYSETKKTAADVTTQISGIAYLLDHHPEWTNVFDILEDYTLPTVYYEDMTVDVGGTMTLTAIAPDMQGVVDQLRVFRLYPEVFTSVDVTETKMIEISVVEEEVAGEEGAEAEQAPPVGAEGAEKATIPKVSFGLELSLNPERILEYTP